MITSADREYRQTKRIKQGKETLSPPFDELANWISVTWEVKVLNVVHDTLDWMDGRPRLQVVLEHRDEVAEFQESECRNFKSIEQQRIADKFRNLLQRSEIRSLKTNDLLVVFSAFAPIAIAEANHQIPDAEIERFKFSLGNVDLWEISRCFEMVVFFFYTDEQVRRYEEDGLRRVYADAYLQLFEKYDEFGYAQRNCLQVTFDSKENFERNYEGNWFLYFK